jgi:hypothetical protein
MPWSKVVLTASLLCLATGCGGGAGKLPSASVVRNPAPNQVVLPFEAYEPTAQERALIQTAQDLLIRNCMEEKGFTWSVPTRTGNRPRATLRRYGVIEPDVAQSFGYHPPPDPEADRLLHLQQSTKLTAAEEEALRGKAGCGPAAVRDLGLEDASKATAQFNSFGQESYAKSESDDRVVNAAKRWSSCMHDEGFKYDSPQEAIADRHWKLDDPAVTPREIAAASADVRCKNKSNFVGVWFSVERAYQQKAIGENPDLFASLKQARESQLQSATQVVQAAAHR